MNVLPVNREERFWTGTVLPALALRDDLSGIGRFVALLRRAAGLPVMSEPAPDEVMFFTEYDIRKSAPSRKGDVNATPDILVVIAGPSPSVYGIEAKLFDAVCSLPWQLAQQKRSLSWIAKQYGAAEFEQIQLGLVPRERVSAISAQGCHAISWDDILSLGPGCGYYHGLLKTALEYYGTNAAPRVHRLEGQCLGDEIQSSPPGCQPPRWIGFAVGKSGSKAFADGSWRKRRYYVNWTSPSAPSRNWMSREVFLERARSLP